MFIHLSGRLSSQHPVLLLLLLIMVLHLLNPLRYLVPLFLLEGYCHLVNAEYR